MDTAKDTPAEQHRMEKEDIEDLGTVTLSRGGHVIHCLTVIGQIEGHTEAPQGQKTTKYEHVIPQLVAVQEDPRIEGLLVLLNTVGGDVETGLALAELIASISQRHAGAGRRALHRHPAGGQRAAQLYCAHRHHDGASGAALRADLGRTADHALL